MAKTVTQNQLIGEIGEIAAKLRFLRMGFQFDVRSRLETGIDGIAEVMADGKPLAQMIAVQVKTTKEGRYAGETEEGFHYLLKSEDLAYWRPSNLPVIIVLYRESDESFYWKEIPRGDDAQERRLTFSKRDDLLDRNAANRVAALTVPKAGFGYYVPPLGGGEEALVNILPIKLPTEVFVATTSYNVRQANAILLQDDEPARFDWVIRGGTFWSFHDPRTSVCRAIVDIDQVEAVDTAHLAFHDDVDERNAFAYLLRQTLDHQVRGELWWSKENSCFYFAARAEYTARVFKYESSKKLTEADVVNPIESKREAGSIAFVRHHAFVPRFESLYDEWYLVVEPTYVFTTNGFTSHPHPDALLAGKKRLDKSASLRGQVIMWHRFLKSLEPKTDDLFAVASSEPRISFGSPPTLELPTRVPDDVWGSPKKDDGDQDEPDLLRRA
ncbi:DUF4365 domain-containing protein [Rhizobium leguminosarum]|uniref:DUF4365 domain-containing protein n=1 Tax=Rhizobium leguminosarum TaxID=384 RepID=UPI00102FC74D|nr:DUF4365 domain-containing protein [Rhizobium leguminosarum]TAY05479.1 DUF4365 domain-containing protein [Rhizobium leguminosarum]